MEYKWCKRKSYEFQCFWMFGVSYAKCVVGDISNLKDKKEMIKKGREWEIVVWCVRWVVLLFRLASDIIVKVSNVTKIPYRSLLVISHSFFFVLFLVFRFFLFVFNFVVPSCLPGSSFSFSAFLCWFLCCSVFSPVVPHILWSVRSSPSSRWLMYLLTLSVPRFSFLSCPTSRQFSYPLPSVVFPVPTNSNFNCWRGLWICCVVFLNVVFMVVCCCWSSMVLSVWLDNCNISPFLYSSKNQIKI